MYVLLPNIGTATLWGTKQWNRAQNSTLMQTSTNDCLYIAQRKYEWNANEIDPPPPSANPVHA